MLFQAMGTPRIWPKFAVIPAITFHLRQEVGALLEAGGDLKDAYYVDQSAYKGLDTYEQLATRNAGRVYEQMEFE